MEQTDSGGILRGVCREREGLRYPFNTQEKKNPGHLGEGNPGDLAP